MFRKNLLALIIVSLLPMCSLAGHHAADVHKAVDEGNKVDVGDKPGYTEGKPSEDEAMPMDTDDSPKDE